MAKQLIKYHFADMKNGRLEHGYVIMKVVNHVVEIDPNNKGQVALAVKWGGRRIKEKADAPKSPKPSAKATKKEA